MHPNLILRPASRRSKRNPGDHSSLYLGDEPGAIVNGKLEILEVDPTAPLFGPQPVATFQFPTTQPAVVVSLMQPLSQVQAMVPTTSVSTENALSTVEISSALAAQTDSPVPASGPLTTTAQATVVNFATSQVALSAQSFSSGTSITVSRGTLSTPIAATGQAGSLALSSVTSSPSTSGAAFATTSTQLHSTNFYVGICFGAIAGLACLLAFISWLIRSRSRSSGCCGLGGHDKYVDMEDHDTGPSAFPTMYGGSIPHHSDGASGNRISNVFPLQREAAFSRPNPFVIPPPKPYSPSQPPTIPRNPNQLARPATAENRRSSTPTPIDQTLGRLKVQNLMPGDISSAEESIAPVLKRDLSALGFIESPKLTAAENDLPQRVGKAAKARADHGTETPLAQALVQCAIAIASTPPPIRSSAIPQSMTPGVVNGRNMDSPWVRDITTPISYQAPVQGVSSPRGATPLSKTKQFADARLSAPTPQSTTFAQLGFGASPGKNASVDSEGWGASLRNNIMSTLSAMTGTGTGRPASSTQEQDIYTSLPSRSSMTEVTLASISKSKARSNANILKMADLEMGYRDTTRSELDRVKSATVPLNVRKRNTTGGVCQSAAHVRKHRERDTNAKLAGLSMGDVELPHFSTLHPNITVRRPRRRNVSAPVASPKPAPRKGTKETRPANLRRVSSCATGRSSTSFSSADSPSGDEMTEGEASAKKAMIMRKARRKRTRASNLGLHASERQSKERRNLRERHVGTPGQKVLRRQAAMIS